MPAIKKSVERMVSKKSGVTEMPVHMGQALLDHVAGILNQARSNGRAAYGKQVMEWLSRRLGEKYGPGFSSANLKNHRQFYLVYPEHCNGNRHPSGSELVLPVPPLTIPRPLGVESVTTPPATSDPAGSESLAGFSPRLSWSHYRALMRVEKAEARDFYERETQSNRSRGERGGRRIQDFRKRLTMAIQRNIFNRNSTSHP